MISYIEDTIPLYISQDQYNNFIKIKPINYKNYFQYAYQKETYPKYDRSKSTLRKKPKNYKLDK